MGRTGQVRSVSGSSSSSGSIASGGSSASSRYCESGQPAGPCRYTLEGVDSQSGTPWRPVTASSVGVFVFAGNAWARHTSVLLSSIAVTLVGRHFICRLLSAPCLQAAGRVGWVRQRRRGVRLQRGGLARAKMCAGRAAGKSLDACGRGLAARPVGAEPCQAPMPEQSSW